MEKELDSIRIELLVTASPDTKDGVCMYGALEVYINQKKPYDESSDIVDESKLFDSVIQNGEYYIFSCCCGVPSCSGWEKGIKVSHQGEHIEWVDENHQKSWVFDKKSIENQLEEVKTEAIFFKGFFEEKEIDYVGVGFNW